MGNIIFFFISKPMVFQTPPSRLILNESVFLTRVVELYGYGSMDLFLKGSQGARQKIIGPLVETLVDLLPMTFLLFDNLLCW